MSMTRDAFEAIREAIVSGNLEFGERLSEVLIAEALGMSKAPVRAAFAELREQGLVNIVPQAGTYVFSPSAEDVRTMSDFRLFLETEALHLAMERNRSRLLSGLKAAITDMSEAIDAGRYSDYRRADSAYHMVMLRESGNRYLPKAYSLTSTALEALRVRLQGGAGGFWDRSFREHKKIHSLLEKDDLAAATELLKSHILVINHSLHTLPAALTNGRGEGATERNYSGIFNR